jgi:hypothetical protein
MCPKKPIISGPVYAGVVGSQADSPKISPSPGKASPAKKSKSELEREHKEANKRAKEEAVVQKKAAAAEKKAAAAEKKAAAAAEKAAAAEAAKTMKEQQEAEAAAAKVEADRANQPIPGTAVIRYNHYKKDVSITTSEANPAGGTVAIAALDEQFSFSLVFNGNFKINLRGPGRKGERLPYQGEAEITGMRDGEEYWCEVDEDAAADDAARGGKAKTTFQASGGDSHIKTGGDDGAMGEDSASCSCIEGNPCQSAYNCKNWNSRFDVAKANGWKGC